MDSPDEQPWAREAEFYVDMERGPSRSLGGQAKVMS